MKRQCLALVAALAGAACREQSKPAPAVGSGSTSSSAVPQSSPAASWVPEHAPAGPAAADTARGTVALTGSEPATQIVLRPAGTGPDIALSSADPASLNRLVGLDVWVEGTRIGPRHFAVARFAVRAADGVQAVDGTLALEGERVLLVTADGRRRPLAQPPVALRNQIGARVWISGPLDRAPNSYGIISHGTI